MGLLITEARLHDFKFRQDYFPVLFAILVAQACETRARRSIYFRGGSNGFLVGGMIVPAIFLSLRAIGSDVRICSLYLHVALTFSITSTIESVLGDGSWNYFNGSALSRSLFSSAVLFLLSNDENKPTAMGAFAAQQVLIRSLLRQLPGSFTAGEAIAVSSGIAILLTDASSTLVAAAGFGATLRQRTPCPHTPAQRGPASRPAAPSPSFLRSRLTSQNRPRNPRWPR